MSYREPPKEDPLRFVIDEEAIRQEAIKRRAAKCTEHRSAWPRELLHYGISSWEHAKSELIVLMFSGLALGIACIVLSLGSICIFVLMLAIMLLALFKLLEHFFGWIAEHSIVAIYIREAFIWMEVHSHFGVLCLFVVIFTYVLVGYKDAVRKAITLLRHTPTARQLVASGEGADQSTVFNWEWMVYREGVRTLLESLLQRSGVPPFNLSRELYYEPSDCFCLYLEQYENTPAERCLDGERVRQHLEVLGHALNDLCRRRYETPQSPRCSAEAARDRQRLNTYDRTLIRQAYEELLTLITAPPVTAPNARVRVADETPDITEHETLHVSTSTEHDPRAAQTVPGENT